MAKPRLEKVRALFYVLQQLTKIGCANFDTASKCLGEDYFILTLFLIRWDEEEQIR